MRLNTVSIPGISLFGFLLEYIYMCECFQKCTVYVRHEKIVYKYLFKNVHAAFRSQKEIICFKGKYLQVENKICSVGFLREDAP